MKLSRHAWILAAALAACAAPGAQWEKPGANAAAVDADSAQCREQVRVAQPSPQAVQQTSRQVTMTALSRDEDRALAEIDHFQQCMRGKGYSAKR